MGVFGDYARKYYEAGFNVFPARGKIPAILNWQRYCHEKITEKEFNKFEQKFPDCNIGLPLGPANDLMLFDYDHTGAGADIFEKIIREILPLSPIERFGAKGFGLFFKYNKAIKIRHIYKDKKIFFDIMAENSQVIIPPSIHPVTRNKYKFIGKYDLFSLKDEEIELPKLDKSILDKCIDLTQSEVEKDIKKHSGRQNLLWAYTCKIIDQVSGVEELYKRVYKKNKEAFQEQSYFDDPKEKKYKRSDQFLKSEVDRWVSGYKNRRKQNGDKWDFKNETSYGSTSYEAYEVFFENKFTENKKDLLTDELMHRHKNRWKPILTSKNVKYLRSHAMQNQLPKQHVEDHLYAWDQSKEPELLINIPNWDGFDHIAAFHNYIKIKNISPTCFIDQWKQWFTNVFARIDNPKHQNKMIIMQGDQGLGKDYFFNHIFRGFEHYYNQMSIRSDEKANFEVMRMLLIANISEFDKTAKMEVSMLKNIITAPSAVFREAYGRQAQNYEFRTNFVSSANVGDILRDYTGNRRYIIFDVESIDWAYTKHVDPMGILAQAYNLYKTGFKIPAASENEMNKFISEETPDDPMELALEIFDERLALYMRDRQLLRARLFDIDAIIKDICNNIDVRKRPFLMFLKRKLRSRKINGTVYYFPKNMKNLESENA